jgi:MFS family permease
MTGEKLRVLVGCTIGSVFGYATLGVVAFAMLISPLSIERGWTTEEIGIALSVMAGTAVFAVPITGALIDRFGARLVIAVSVGLTATTLSLLSLAITNLTYFYLLYALLALSAVGTLATSYTKVITTKFDANRGLAIGIVLAGTGVGAIVLPLLLHSVVGNFGVQTAYKVLAALALISGVPAVLLLDHNTVSVQSVAAPKFRDMRLRVMHHFATRIGVKMLGLSYLLGIYTGATWAKIVPLMIDRGNSAEMAAFAMTFVSVALVIARLGAGYLVDRFFAPFVAAAFILPVALSWMVLSMGASGIWVVICAVFLGVGMGAEFDFLAYLTGRYFPKEVYGTFFGFFYSMQSIGAASAPILFYFSPGDTVSLGVLAATTFAAVVLLTTFEPFPDSSKNGRLAALSL